MNLFIGGVDKMLIKFPARSYLVTKKSITFALPKPKHTLCPKTTNNAGNAPGTSRRW